MNISFIFLLSLAIFEVYAKPITDDGMELTGIQQIAETGSSEKIDKANLIHTESHHEEAGEFNDVAKRDFGGHDSGHHGHHVCCHDGNYEGAHSCCDAGHGHDRGHQHGGHDHCHDHGYEFYEEWGECGGHKGACCGHHGGEHCGHQEHEHEGCHGYHHGHHGGHHGHEAHSNHNGGGGGYGGGYGY